MSSLSRLARNWDRGVELFLLVLRAGAEPSWEPCDNIDVQQLQEKSSNIELARDAGQAIRISPIPSHQRNVSLPGQVRK
ncbi:uncharacterized protein KY384_003883 [Bacidia gigantensis]|uniref:uncharacterized protein n=1 Tax=Bacidia gigantensis TaxID=2732470 RepID=UPI001D03FC1C|nr:uncharacterized protein KY384_003883 [Bacidia gigantensis]KAG8532242.1 hypothetical protein KY384_003883 [Bacidia gigantensis]